MNYELAKELEDAGFPYKSSPTCRDPHDHKGDDCSYGVYPTLEELIEACFPRFGYLNYMEEANLWSAWGREAKSCIGSTPTEAVARLWLALHQK